MSSTVWSECKKTDSTYRSTPTNLLKNGNLEQESEGSAVGWDEYGMGYSVGFHPGRPTARSWTRSRMSPCGSVSVRAMSVTCAGEECYEGSGGASQWVRFNPPLCSGATEGEDCGLVLEGWSSPFRVTRLNPDMGLYALYMDVYYIDGVS